MAGRGNATMKKIMEGVLFWAFIGIGVYLIRPHSSIHRTTVSVISKRQILCLILAVILVIAGVVFCSTLSPMWNGTIINHKDEYEMITESFLKHRLDFDIPVDPRLREMKNPYDTEARTVNGVSYPFDHAYYQGHFYMYYGVVPVFLAFLPYRVITGQPLPGIHATQFFASIFILGLAAYFLWLARSKFPGMTFGVILMLIILFSMLSTLFVAKYPMLYQTPVACGMMLEIWSLFFFSKAVWEERTERSAIRWAFWGSLFGALTFGCRPPLALANLTVIPLLCFFLKGKRFSWKLLSRLCFAASPYVLVAIGLMWYNYARFGNPFEFGQAYQLTVDDMTKVGHIQGLNGLVSTLAGTCNLLFSFPPLQTQFPFLSSGMGAFACCPLLLYAFSGIRPAYKRFFREKGMHSFLTVLLISVVVTFFLDLIWSTVSLERYKSDVLYLLSTGAFIGIGGWMSRKADYRSASWKVCLAAYICIVLVVLLFLIPDDYSYTAYYNGTNEWLWSRISFNLSW